MLTNDKQVKSSILAIVPHPVAAGAVLYKGALCVLDADDNLASGTSAAGLRVIGINRRYVSNEAGIAGAVSAEVRVDETPRLNNDAVAPVTRAHISSDCYILDDETVSSDGTGRSRAGTVVNVDSNGVWIKF